MDPTASSRWAAEVAADTIAGQQSTGALLGRPSKALLCPVQDWSCIVQSTGVSIEVAAIYAVNYSLLLSSLQSNGLFAFY